MTGQAFGFNSDALFTVSSILANGNELPSWIVFDELTKTLKIRDTSLLKVPLEIIIKAMDKEGHVKTIVFKLLPDQTQSERNNDSDGLDVKALLFNQTLASKVDLSEQLGKVGMTGFHQQRMKLLESLETVNRDVV